jgi:hypothetical protein
MSYRLLYLGMIIVASKLIAAQSWTHWVLKPYADQGIFQDGVPKLFWVSLLAIFLDFTCFLLCCATLILSWTQEHFCFAEGVSLEVANIVINKAARKVIKDASNMPALSLLPYTTLRYFIIHCNICCI